MEFFVIVVDGVLIATILMLGDSRSVGLRSCLCGPLHEFEHVGEPLDPLFGRAAGEFGSVNSAGLLERQERGARRLGVKRRIHS